jgi:hypothetical protein
MLKSRWLNSIIATMSANSSEKFLSSRVLSLLLIGFTAGALTTYFLFERKSVPDTSSEKPSVAPNNQYVDSFGSKVRRYGFRQAKLEAQFQFRGEGDGGIPGFLETLIEDGAQELVENSAKELLNRFRIPGLDLDNLQKIQIGEIKDGEASMEFFFDFGEKGQSELEMPGGKLFTVEGDSLVVGTAQPREETIKEKTIVISDKLQFFFNESGIVRVRKNDIRYFIFPLNFRTERAPGKILKHEGRSVLELDEEGAPLIKDGSYVPMQFDDWIIIESGLNSYEVPIPAVD